jgi:hypothetical protein
MKVTIQSTPVIRPIRCCGSVGSSSTAPEDRSGEDVDIFGADRTGEKPGLARVAGRRRRCRRARAAA